MKTIVFCEDSPTIRKLIGIAMRDTPHRVLIAEDGQEGLQLIREHRPQLVVTDLAMPNLDGLALYDHMQKDPDIAATPVVFLTASTQRSLMTGAVERTPRELIRKPFSPGQLRERVEAILAEPPDLA